MIYFIEYIFITLYNYCDPQLCYLAHIGLSTGSSKSVHEEIFMLPVNSSLLLKLLRQIMQLPNLSHDFNFIVLLHCAFNGLLAVRTG